MRHSRGGSGCWCASTAGALAVSYWFCEIKCDTHAGGKSCEVVVRGCGVGTKGKLKSVDSEILERGGASENCGLGEPSFDPPPFLSGSIGSREPRGESSSAVEREIRRV